MAGSKDAGSADDALGRTLATLGSGLRIQILRQLRSPRAVREIQVQSGRADAGGLLSRQSVQEHLDRLLEAGVVAPVAAAEDLAGARTFAINHQAIYGIAEEVRELARLRPTIEPSRPTTPLHHQEHARTRGPRLTLVKGLEEGAIFDLDPRGGRAAWTIGRRRGLPVSLDFDPYVSSENATITWREGAHRLATVPGSRNGTLLNFERLEDGDEAPLAHGDLISVGRSALLYWA